MSADSSAVPAKPCSGISVIITMAPGREDHLRGCLRMLTYQSFSPLEVLVCDDGSAEAAVVCEQFASDLSIRHLWRPNDCCVSRSRNLGSEQAQAEYFLFLDCDVLLNPEGLQAYREHFAQLPVQAIAGMMGNRLERVAESVLIPGRQVNYLDKRILSYQRQGIEITHSALKRPYHFGWGGNLAVARSIFEATGGFDEGYVGWGDEDNQFCVNLVRAGYQLHFALDTWCEHQVHPRSSHFYTLRRPSKKFIDTDWPEVNYKVRLWGEPQRSRAYIAKIFNEYLQRDFNLPESFVYQMAYPDAKWDVF